MGQYVLYKDIHVIDLDCNEVSKGVISDDLNGFILELVDRINESEKLQFFKITDENKSVIKQVKEIINNLYVQNEIEENFDKSKNIAEKLLEVEISTQEKIDRMNVKMRKGCLLQTAFYDEDTDEYFYLLTKTEYTSYIEEINFTKKTGFNAEVNNLWRSCLITMNIENDKIIIGDIKIYLDKQAIHWHKEFLELEPLRNDEKNTKMLFTQVESVIKKVVSPASRHEYILLRSNLIGFMRRNKLIDYDKLLQEVIINYQGQNLSTEVKEMLIQKLEDLPEIKKFDRQFTFCSTALNPRIIKMTYELSDIITIVIKDRIKNLNDTKEIVSEIDALGNKYIKIKTNNTEAFETFLIKKNIL